MFQKAYSLRLQTSYIQKMLQQLKKGQCSWSHPDMGSADFLIGVKQRGLGQHWESDPPSHPPVLERFHDPVEANFEDMVLDLRCYTSALLDLLPSIEQAAAFLNHKYSRDHATWLKSHTQNPANPFIIKILDRFGDRNSTLKERLGEANWLRHRRLLEKVSKDIHGAVAAEKNEVAVLVPASKVSKFKDSAISGMNTLPRSFKTLPSSTSSHVPPSFSIYMQQHETSRTAKSVSSHKSLLSSTTVMDTGNGDLQLPSVPLQVENRTPFVCEICWELQTEIKDRAEWKYNFYSSPILI
jgi:hypothetical protein